MTEDICKCESCGCTGNSECGCEPLNNEKMCTLDRFGVCYCCREIGAEANIRRWTYNENQCELFND